MQSSDIAGTDSLLITHAIFEIYDDVSSKNITSSAETFASRVAAHLKLPIFPDILRQLYEQIKENPLDKKGLVSICINNPEADETDQKPLESVNSDAEIGRITRLYLNFKEEVMSLREEYETAFVAFINKQLSENQQEKELFKEVCKDPNIVELLKSHCGINAPITLEKLLSGMGKSQVLQEKITGQVMDADTLLDRKPSELVYKYEKLLIEAMRQKPSETQEASSSGWAKVVEEQRSSRETSLPEKK